MRQMERQKHSTGGCNRKVGYADLAFFGTPCMINRETKDRRHQLRSFQEKQSLCDEKLAPEGHRRQTRKSHNDG